MFQLLFLYRMIKYSPPTYDDGTPYPHFAQSIGWAILSFVLCPIPLWFFYHMFATFRKHSDLPFWQVREFH
jgi:hypothetical protein